MTEQAISFQGGRISYYDEDGERTIVVCTAVGKTTFTNYFTVDEFMYRIFGAYVIPDTRPAATTTKETTNG
jgi:hypothetical protein